MIKKIYYHDTDCGGVVYYSNYLRYFEEGRTEYLGETGADLKELAGNGVLFAVRKAEIDYKAPARYGDTIEILTRVGTVKNTSMEFLQEAKIGDKLLVGAKIVLVCIDKNFKPLRLPKEVCGKMGKIMKGGTV